MLSKTKMISCTNCKTKLGERIGNSLQSFGLIFEPKRSMGITCFCGKKIYFKLDAEKKAFDRKPKSAKLG